MYSLTQTQIEHFQNKGWVGPLDAFSVAEIQSIKDYLTKNSHKIEVDGQYILEFSNNFLGYKTKR